MASELIIQPHRACFHCSQTLAKNEPFIKVPSNQQVYCIPCDRRLRGHMLPHAEAAYKQWLVDNAS